MQLTTIWSFHTSPYTCNQHLYCSPHIPITQWVNVSHRFSLFLITPLVLYSFQYLYWYHIIQHLLKLIVELISPRSHSLTHTHMIDADIAWGYPHINHVLELCSMFHFHWPQLLSHMEHHILKYVLQYLFSHHYYLLNTIPIVIHKLHTNIVIII